MQLMIIVIVQLYHQQRNNTPHKQILTPQGNFESPIKLKWMFFAFWEKIENHLAFMENKKTSRWEAPIEIKPATF